jgi:hypothetical protein
MLLVWAKNQLILARAEAAEGYLTEDPIRIRKAAERAWKAACAATDAAMVARSVPRDGTTADRPRHYEYLDSLGREDLVHAYAYFADRLHRLCAHDGHVPCEALMKAHFAKVETYIAAVNDGA